MPESLSERLSNMSSLQGTGGLKSSAKRARGRDALPDGDRPSQRKARRLGWAQKPYEDGKALEALGGRVKAEPLLEEHVGIGVVVEARDLAPAGLAVERGGLG